MTRVFSAGGSRQPAVFAAILALHFGLFLAVLYGLGPRILIPPADGPPPVQLLPPEPARVEPVVPAQPELFGGRTDRVVEPPIRIPRFESESDAVAVPRETAARGVAGEGTRLPDDVAPALRTPRNRLAAVVASCYPAASRRLGEEGRVMAWLAIDAHGAVTAWRVAASSGFPRLDAAAQCVIDRLQFVAGRRDGRAVATEATLPVVFRLD